MYKYDTTNDTYTQMTSTSFGMPSTASVVAVGNKIHILGGGSSNSEQVRHNIYDVTTEQTSSASNLPFYHSSGGACVYGNNIHILGGYRSYNHYVYDTTNDTYTQKANINNTYRSPSYCVLGSFIYAFGGGNQAGMDMYATNGARKYDIQNNTWTDLTNVPNAIKYATAAPYGDYIYLFGGYSNNQKTQVYIANSTSYVQDDVVVIAQQNGSISYNVELFSNTKVISPLIDTFADAWYYTTQDGLITNIPTYYGNGTSWIKIKN